MLTPIETSIIKGLINDETYTRRVLPHLEAEYFEDSTGRTYFRLCKEYFEKYDSCTNTESLSVEIQALENLSDDEAAKDL